MHPDDRMRAIRDKVAEILEVEVGEVEGTTCSATHPQWDSLAHMMIINAIEKHFTIQLPRLTAYTVKNVGELDTAVGAALAAK